MKNYTNTNNMLEAFSVSETKFKKMLDAQKSYEWASLSEEETESYFKNNDFYFYDTKPSVFRCAKCGRFAYRWKNNNLFYDPKTNNLILETIDEFNIKDVLE